MVEAIKSRTLYVKKYDEEYTVAKNHKYYSRVQHKIDILVNKQCDFVVWISKDSLSIRTEIDQDFLNAMIENCDSCRKEIILHWILDWSSKNNIPL